MRRWGYAYRGGEPRKTAAAFRAWSKWDICERGTKTGVSRRQREGLLHVHIHSTVGPQGPRGHLADDLGSTCALLVLTV